jgi:hypothetical protein
MQLTDDQKQAVRQWVKEGAGLSEIQRRLTQEFSISLTYLDVRFLVIELGVSVQEKQASSASTKLGPDKADLEPGADDAELVDEDENPAAEDESWPAPGAGGAVSVDVDRIMKPGSLVSGTVTFSDGVKASWGLDQFGRLAIDAGKQYRPSQQDVQSFQIELRKVLEKRGF